MEQTSTMDKKLQSRPPPLQCKGSQDPSKSGYDHSSKRNGAQYGRKRENERNDGYKKSPGNRGGRAGQRYVRPREKMGCQVESRSSESEFGSLQRGGGKKQNITHLLNWWGPGPERHLNRGRTGDLGSPYGQRNRKYSGHHVKFNKEHYLQANCQFVVTAGQDYSSYKTDPDRLVDWEFVEEVRLHSSEYPSCPICLHPPVAAKVTRCGHIFCYPCILHYLALTDEKWRKCPICFDAVSRKDLRSVMTIVHKDFSSSHEITLVLMRRDRESIIPVPTTCSPSLSEERTTLSSSGPNLIYSKLIVADKNEVSKFIVMREKDDLMCQLALEGDQPEACFIEEAISLVTQRESLLKHEDDLQEDQQLPLREDQHQQLPLREVKEQHIPLHEIHQQLPLHDHPQHALREEHQLLTLREDVEMSTEIEDPVLDPFIEGPSLHSLSLKDSLGSPENVELPGTDPGEALKLDSGGLSIAGSLINIQLEDLDIGQLQRCAPSTNQDGKGGPKSTFYFYQESSGAHVYLHAMNVHMLVREYGSLENCPPVITAKVIEKESDTMSESLRQRLRYLRHLPITCPFEVVEIEIKPPLASQLTIAEFQGQLEHRERKRKKRAKEEHRIEKRAQVEEDRLMGRSRGAKINMTSFKHFPSFTEEHQYSPPTSEIPEESVTSPPSIGSPPDDISDRNPPSFAQMIRCGQKKGLATPVEAFPSLGSTGNRLVSPRHEKREGRACVPGGDSEDEETERVPDFNTAFSDAFAKALDKATKNANCKSVLADDRENSGSNPRGKKNKKKKGIVLLSSGGR